MSKANRLLRVKLATVLIYGFTLAEYAFLLNATLILGVSEAGLLYKSFSLGVALSVTHFVLVVDLNLITLGCVSQVRLGCLTNRSVVPSLALF